MTKHFIRLFLLASTLPLAQAADFSVSSSSSFNNAIATADPGDRIIWQNGDYSNMGFSFNASGTAARPITIMAQTPGGVTFSGVSYFLSQGDYINFEGLVFDHESQSLSWDPSHSSAEALIELRGTGSEISNCGFHNYDRTDVSAGSTPFFYVRLGDDNHLVEFCDFGPKSMTGNMLNVEIDANGTSTNDGNHVIRNNYFHDFNAPDPEDFPQDYDTEVIRIGNRDSQFASSDTLVEKNLFFRCSGEAELITSKTTDATYLQNSFVECRGTLTLRLGTSCNVIGNIFLGNRILSTGGVRAVGPDHVIVNNLFQQLWSTGRADVPTALVYGQPDGRPTDGYLPSDNVLIAHNTYVENNRNIVIGSDYSSGSRNVPPTDAEVVNNLFLRCNPENEFVDHRTDASSFTSPSYANNVYFEGSLGSPSSSGGAFYNEDPSLAFNGWHWVQSMTDPGAAVDRSSSPASIAEAANDYEGQPRNGTPDVGHDELSTASISAGLLQPNDVGTTWFRNRANSRGIIEFDQADALRTINEPSSGSKDLTITLNRIGGSSGSASATVAPTTYLSTRSDSTTPGGDAEAGDYATFPGDTPDATYTVSWANGESGPKTISVPINGDGNNESDYGDLLYLSITETSNAVMGLRGNIVVRIFDPSGQNISLGDNDEDGFSNLMEAALGTNANNANSFPCPTLTEGSSNDTYAFTKASNEFGYAVQTSEDLTQWNTEVYFEDGTDVEQFAPDVSVSHSGNTVNVSLPTSGQRKFVRLMVVE